MAALLLWGSGSPMVGDPVVYAQRLDPDQLQQFLSDPLTDQPRDPALPQPEVSRALSPLELYELEVTLDGLDARAQSLLLDESTAGSGAFGNSPSGNNPSVNPDNNQPNNNQPDNNQPDVNELDEDAFDLWLREVRLRRVLGREAELTALERVIPLVWNNQRGLELRLLTQRLRAIWNETAAQPEPSEADLARLLDLFVLLRDEKAVVTLTQGLADQAAARGDGVTQRQRLADLGEAYLGWFEFDQAATVYEALVADADSRSDLPQERALLQQLIYSYQQGEHYELAIPYQQRLLALYRAAALSESEVPLEIAIARNYRALENYPRAVEYYQLAYRTAQKLEQYGYASEALQELAQLYQDVGQLDDAVTLYNLLVRVEQQSYNHYGILLAYEQLGQLYVALNDTENALVALRAGLAFAEALNYRQADFQAQISALE